MPHEEKTFVGVNGREAIVLANLRIGREQRPLCFQALESAWVAIELISGWRGYRIVDFPRQRGSARRIRRQKIAEKRRSGAWNPEHKDRALDRAPQQIRPRGK